MKNGTDYSNTYCNPIPLPDYPLGRNCVRNDRNYERDYRETADPTVLYEDGKWYLYPSCGMLYVSEDFRTWTHLRMEPYDIGYAPTVVKHRGRFLLTACGSELYASDRPEGPFQSLGPFRDEAGQRISFSDPMLFSDEDGRLYLYSGCGEAICGCELDAADPTRLISPNRRMFAMDLRHHEWERMGEWHEDASYSWIEGSWMYKRNGIYYLTYSAPGTEWSTYAMGAYTGTSPLGPWTYMASSPFLGSTHGLIRGAGHGCIVDGPGGTAWVFYTCCVCHAGMFERRICFDPVGFGEDGSILPVHVSETPAWAPGTVSAPERSNLSGLLPLTRRKRAAASSSAPGRDPIYATDDSLITWWQPEPSDPEPSLTVRLSHMENVFFTVAAAQVIWTDVGLDIQNGVLPGPFGYVIEARTRDGWIPVLDRSGNRTDLLIDYAAFSPVLADEVRIRVTKRPAGIEPGLVCFTAFGFYDIE